MRNRNEARSVATLLATLLALGAGCHLDALLGPPGGGRWRQGGLASLEQLRSDTTTPIPSGGSTPEPSIVVRAVVRDTATRRSAWRLRYSQSGSISWVSRRPRAPTSSGSPAYFSWAGCRTTPATIGKHAPRVPPAWQPFGGTAPNVADFSVVLPVPPPDSYSLGSRLRRRRSHHGAAVEVTLVDAQAARSRPSRAMCIWTSPEREPERRCLGGDRGCQRGRGCGQVLQFEHHEGRERIPPPGDCGRACGSRERIVRHQRGHRSHPKFLVQPSNTTPNTGDQAGRAGGGDGRL